MAMTQLPLKICLGKKLVAYRFSEEDHERQLILIFDDRTFTTLEANLYHYELPGLSEGVIDLSTFGDQALVETGVLTAEELKKYRS